MDKVKGGWAMNRERFSEAAREILDVALDHRRQGLKLPDGALRGYRFYDDAAILMRLESMFTEEEFMACPGLRIDNALIDAAQSDRWYTYSKDYGTYDGYATEIDDEEFA